MLNFLTSKLGRSPRVEGGSEVASEGGERGMGITSNQSEYSESVLVPPSEQNQELNESADQIVLSQLQRENDDLKEVCKYSILFLTTL